MHPGLPRVSTFGSYRHSEPCWYVACVAAFQCQGSAAALAGLASLIVKMHPQAGGSGLPEVKETLVCVLDSNPNPNPNPNPNLNPSASLDQAGIVLFDSFSLKTLGLKMLALALAVGSGLSIGKEGPLALVLAPSP